MTASAFTTRTAQSAELEATTQLCLAAFADEAVASWVVPDPICRQEHMRQMFSTSLGAAVAAGSLTLALGPDDEPVAASIWASRGAGGEPEEPAPAAQDDPVLRRLATVQAMTKGRQPDVAHFHLSAMAVLPRDRGRGAGGAMIAAGLEQARRLKLPVYLEASTPDNRRLYERFGFTDFGDPIALPDGGPSLQPMWRES